MATASISENSYFIPPDWTSKYNIANCKTAPIELMPTNSPYCFKVWIAEKFLSSNVHHLFRKKFEVIEQIIPIAVAWTYHKFASIPPDSR